MHLPVIIPLRFSRQLAVVLTAAHGLAVAAILAIELAWEIRGTLLAFVAASLLLSLHRQRHQPVMQLHLGRKGELMLDLNIGAGETALLLPETTVLPGLILLAMRSAGRKRYIALLPDATSAEDRRRLRVWLMWRAKAEAARVSA